MDRKVSLPSRWYLVAGLILMNGAFFAATTRDAKADDPCSTAGHCHCFDDGSGPYCSHVMGTEVECERTSDCKEN
jgi:hypothetical protein